MFVTSEIKNNVCIEPYQTLVQDIFRWPWTVELPCHSPIGEAHFLMVLLCVE